MENSYVHTSKTKVFFEIKDKSSEQVNKNQNFDSVTMIKSQDVCFVCKSTENIVCTFPQTQETFDKWLKILNIVDPIKPKDKKKICILHFDKKWENIMLQGNARRCAYIFPSPVSRNNNKRSISPSLMIPSTTTLHNSNKKQVNVDLVLQMKQDQIKELTEKVKALEIENKSLKRTSAIKKDFESAATELPANAATLIKVFVARKGSGARYSKSEKHLCQTLYYKDPGYYAFLRKSLDGLLPSKSTLLRWQPIKSLNIGIVPETIAYLKESANSLTVQDRQVIIIMDEMDGRQGLQYDTSRDCIIGFECLIKKTKSLAKKFLTVMVRGVNGRLGNIIIANFATAKGITGNYRLLLLFSLLFQTFCHYFRSGIVNFIALFDSFAK